MAEQQNIREAEQTYAGFISFMKIGTVAAIAVTALVVVLIS